MQNVRYNQVPEEQILSIGGELAQIISIFNFISVGSHFPMGKPHGATAKKTAREYSLICQSWLSFGDLIVSASSLPAVISLAGKASKWVSWEEVDWGEVGAPLKPSIWDLLSRQHWVFWRTRKTSEEVQASTPRTVCVEVQ